MLIDGERAAELLRQFDFTTLFIEELGWDRSDLAPTSCSVEGCEYLLDSVAQKRGVQVLKCVSTDSTGFPPYRVRQQVDRHVRKTAYEHLIIFVDSDKTQQVWQWVSKEPGRAVAYREHHYDGGQSGTSLVQKLAQIAFPLSEEEALTLTGVTLRLRDALDRDRITKRFYDRFKTEQAALLECIEGINDLSDRAWYSSVMLNRLMFVYFVQKKGFLNDDLNYLRNKLTEITTRENPTTFLTFYRHFLVRLFHEGLGSRDRASDLDALLGRVPYLNGGLFDVHQLESAYPDIDVPNKAFERLFAFFDEYQWHLDDRPLADDNEINPDVLGYIFEKYVNQKQMGAYYTREDITEYISRNTLVPFLFDAAKSECGIGFETRGGSSVWDLLKSDPDRYIYSAVRHGAGKPAPSEIADGLRPPTLHATVGNRPAETLGLRAHWNTLAPGTHALPAETWREAIVRHDRYESIRDRLASGEVSSIDELISLNLDLEQFAQDVVESCEDPELLRAFWHAIEGVTVLDPTCGSGAFLFATLNILEALYEACLDRMEAFTRDREQADGRRSPIDPYSDFQDVLARVASHPNRRYFILKSIILNNLYGVDIMEEAVEICKLRLFLKLAAQVEPDFAKTNQGVEPLPDIDFNIRAGNTLVGFATYEEVQDGLSSRLDFDDAAGRISAKAADLEAAFGSFRSQQIEGDDVSLHQCKLKLSSRLSALEDELSQYLAAEYRVSPSQSKAYTNWLSTHQPFHWFIEFHKIMSDGGFDVVIGNPPYVELRELSDYEPRGYSCEESGNLYALVMERCAKIGHPDGRQGFIVPVSSVSTDRYVSLQNLLSRREDYFSSYDDRPSRLFDGLEHIRLTVHILGRSVPKPHMHSTKYNKWMASERPTLFETLRFARSMPGLVAGTFPKLSSEIEESIISKLGSQHRTLASFYSRTGRNKVFYSRKVGYFLQVLDFEPRVLDGQGNLRPPSEFKELRFGSEAQAKLVLCCLNSSLFYWFITAFSDCRHVNKREVDAFPIDLGALEKGPGKDRLTMLGEKLMGDLQASSIERVMRFRHDTLTVQCIYPSSSKPIIDKIDKVLAQHYGFTEEELDFVINYDIKYRI